MDGLVSLLSPPPTFQCRRYQHENLFSKIFIRSDEGLTPETSVFQIFHGALIRPLETRLIEPNFQVFHRRSTTVSLETRKLLTKYPVWQFCPTSTVTSQRPDSVH